MKSILLLPPVLQELWSRVYAAVIASSHNVNAKRNEAEEQAWEAVRRANGGEMPEEPRKVDDKTLKRSAIREALLWFADEGHYEGTYRQGAGFVDAVGLTKAREALGIPIERDDRSLMPLAEALTHSVTIGPDVNEPTDEEMVDALAPIVARLEYGSRWDAIPWSEQEERISWARMALREPDDSPMRPRTMLAIASWKAARAWGRK